mmetsp:Transcript_27767/g.77839  ORF Transcript_27767/g.77839 Transcript_27767/m.77839 type:complete len:247 (+) Transcript_27767:200-940(+)
MERRAAPPITHNVRAARHRHKRGGAHSAKSTSEAAEAGSSSPVTSHTCKSGVAHGDVPAPACGAPISASLLRGDSSAARALPGSASWVDAQASARGAIPASLLRGDSSAAPALPEAAEVVVTSGSESSAFGKSSASCALPGFAKEGSKRFAGPAPAGDCAPEDHGDMSSSSSMGPRSIPALTTRAPCCSHAGGSVASWVQRPRNPSEMPSRVMALAAEAMAVPAKSPTGARASTALDQRSCAFCRT